MNRDSDSSERPPMSVSSRQLLLALPVGILMVFIVAVRLNPDHRGFGTHQQLGLPPCAFRVLTGMKCPQCGMTTSFAFLVRGDVSASLHANSAGIVLAPLLMLVGIVSLISGIMGRRIPLKDPLKWISAGGIGFLVLNFLLWLMQILPEVI